MLVSDDPAVFWQHGHGYSSALPALRVAATIALATFFLAGIGRSQLRVLAGASQPDDILRFIQRALKLAEIKFTAWEAYLWTRHSLVNLPDNPAAFGVDRARALGTCEATDENPSCLKPLHLQPVFANCECDEGAYAEDLFEHGLCASGSNLTTEELERVIHTIALVHCGVKLKSTTRRRCYIIVRERLTYVTSDISLNEREHFIRALQKTHTKSATIGIDYSLRAVFHYLNNYCNINTPPYFFIPVNINGAPINCPTMSVNVKFTC